MPWLLWEAFGARTPIAEVTPRLRETALEARYASPNSDHDRGERRWKPAFSPSKKKKNINYLVGGNHARSASSRRRYYTVKIVRRRRRTRGLLTEAICAALFHRLATPNEHLLELKEVPPRSPPDSVVDGTVPQSSCRLPLAREHIFARVVGGSKAHSRSSSGRGRGERARDTTIVI